MTFGETIMHGLGWMAIQLGHFLAWLATPIPAIVEIIAAIVVFEVPIVNLQLWAFSLLAAPTYFICALLLQLVDKWLRIRCSVTKRALVERIYYGATLQSELYGRLFQRMSELSSGMSRAQGYVTSSYVNDRGDFIVGGGLSPGTGLNTRTGEVEHGAAVGNHWWKIG